MALNTLKPKLAMAKSTPLEKQVNSASWKNPDAPSMYGWKWQKARLEWLKAKPWCMYCLRDIRVSNGSPEHVTAQLLERGVLPTQVMGNVVDHIVPHRGDTRLFWDKLNWQTLCKRHHDRDKQSEERKF